MTGSTYEAIILRNLDRDSVWKYVCNDFLKRLFYYEMEHRSKRDSISRSFRRCDKSDNEFGDNHAFSMLMFSDFISLNVWQNSPIKCNACSYSVNRLPDGVLDKVGQYALHGAVLFCQYVKVKELLKSGANTMVKLSCLEITPLVLSVILGHMRMFQLLWENTLDKHQRSECLHISAYYRHKREIFRFIAEKGYINDKNSLGNTVLHMETERRLENIEEILEFGADVDCKNAKGETALIIACRLGSQDNILALLKYGACVNTPNGSGETALSLIRNQQRLQHCTAYIQKELYIMEKLGFTLHRKNVQSMMHMMLDGNYVRYCEKRIKELRNTFQEVNMTYFDFITKNENFIISRTLPLGLSLQNKLKSLVKLETFYRCNICYRSVIIDIVPQMDAILKWKCRSMHRKVLSHIRTTFNQIISELLPRDLPEFCVINITCYLHDAELMDFCSAYSAGVS